MVKTVTFTGGASDTWPVGRRLDGPKVSRAFSSLLVYQGHAVGLVKGQIIYSEALTGQPMYESAG